MATFQQAYEAAAARYSREEWATFGPSEITRMIYEEMRRLDAEAAGATIAAQLEGRTSNGG
jgi:hypothetical protein